MNKYELTEETKKTAEGVTLRRIKYADGSLGGWLENQANLSQDGKSRVDGEALIYGDAYATEAVQQTSPRISATLPDRWRRVLSRGGYR